MAKLPSTLFVLRTLDGELYRSQPGLWAYTCQSAATRHQKRLEVRSGQRGPLYTRVVRVPGADIELLRAKGEQIMLDDRIIAPPTETPAEGAPYA